MKLSTLGEFGFLEALGLFTVKTKKGWLGPGDDAAAIPPLTGELLVSTDLLLEDVHFRLSTTDPRRLGYKTLAVNVSDIAAMGGRPVAFTLAAALPPELELGLRGEHSERARIPVHVANQFVRAGFWSHLTGVLPYVVSTEPRTVTRVYWVRGVKSNISTSPLR